MSGEGWAVYADGHPGARRDTLRNPRFADQPNMPTPFDWQPSEADFVSARIAATAPGQGELVFSTASGEGGEVARQLEHCGKGGARAQRSRAGGVDDRAVGQRI